MKGDEVAGGRIEDGVKSEGTPGRGSSITLLKA